MVNCCNQILIRGGGAKVLADISNQVGQADVTRWGIVAMVFGGVALLSFSLSGNVPDSVSTALHATRVQGANANVLRQQVSDLQNQQLRIDRNLQLLDGQLRVSERDQGDLIRRLSALETAIPALLEVVPPDAELDYSLTGSIEDPEEESFDAEGGSVTVTQSPMFPEEASAEETEDVQDMPALPPSLEEIPIEETAPEVILTASQYGLAIGEVITDETAETKWADLRQSVGTLLIGLEPALSEPSGTGDSRIIVGPISDYAAAETLCARIARAGVPCLPVQYVDEDLLALDALNATN